jgi:hypothetical protein
MGVFLSCRIKGVAKKRKGNTRSRFLTVVDLLKSVNGMFNYNLCKSIPAHFIEGETRNGCESSGFAPVWNGMLQ